MKKTTTLLGTLFTLSVSCGFSQTTQTFGYTGMYDSLIIECSGTVTLEAYGARGVDGDAAGTPGGTGGAGAYASGEIAVRNNFV